MPGRADLGRGLLKPSFLAAWSQSSSPTPTACSFLIEIQVSAWFHTRLWEEREIPNSAPNPPRGMGMSLALTLCCQFPLQSCKTSLEAAPCEPEPTCSTWDLLACQRPPCLAQPRSTSFILQETQISDGLFCSGLPKYELDGL